MTARSEMEATLVGEIKTTVDSIVQAQGLDLIFDKSFLPKANKAILYTSEKVKDLTDEVVAALNAGAPPDRRLPPNPRRKPPGRTDSGTDVWPDCSGRGLSRG